MDNTSKDYLFENDARILPEYLGRWFIHIEGSDMYQVNLANFIYLGKTLKDINEVKEGSTNFEAARHLLSLQAWLNNFLSETKETDKQIPVPRSKEAAVSLIKTISSIIQDGADKAKRDSEISSWTTIILAQEARRFETEFAHECLEIGVFAVTAKGDRSIKILVENASKKFSSNLLAVMPQVTIDDLNEAGRCLAFERPTACAFHVCRATEALMIAYYEALTGQAWPPLPMRKVWQVIVDQLTANKAPKEITNRLGELREDRNSYAHPDVTVPLDEAPIVYDLCTGVMFYMAKEIERIEAAKAAASPPTTSL